MKIPNLTPRLTIAMVAGDPTLVFWHVGDFYEAMQAGRDMGLPVTTPPDVADEVIARILWGLDDSEDLFPDE